MINSSLGALRSYLYPNIFSGSSFRLSMFMNLEPFTYFIVLVSGALGAVLLDWVYRRSIRWKLSRWQLRTRRRGKSEQEIGLKSNLIFRVYRNKRNAAYMLIMAAFTLTFGILLFLQAASFVGYQAGIKATKEQLDAVLSHPIIGDSSFVHGTVQTIEHLTKNVDRLLNDPLLLTDSALQSEAKSAKTRLRELNQLKPFIDPHAMKTELDSVHGDLTRLLDTPPNFKQTVLDEVKLGLIRIGIVVILGFACQIILRIYRYYARTADHYRAVMDALQLQEFNAISLQQAFAIVKNNVDIGRSPTPPSEKMIETMNELIRRTANEKIS